MPTNARLGQSGLSTFGPFTLPVTMAAMVSIPSDARVAVRVEQWAINPHSYAPSAARYVPYRLCLFMCFADLWGVVWHLAW